MMRRLAAVILPVALAAGACADAPGPGSGVPRVVPLSGDVRLVHDGEALLLEEGAQLSAGDRLLTETGGRAEVVLPGERRLELAPDAEFLLGEEDQPELLAGSALVRTGPGLSLGTGDARIEGRDTVFRVDRGFSTTVGVYRGAAFVPGSGLEPIPALREATLVAGGAIPRGPQPLSVRPDDPWDAELLGAAIDLGIDLSQLERGLARQLPGDAGPTITSVLDDFPKKLLSSVLREARPAESVVAAVLAQEGARLAGVSLGRALEDVVDLRLLGADWIIVVAEWRLASTEVLRELGRITGLIARAVAPPPAASGQAAAGGGGGGGGGTGGTSPTTSSGGTTTGGTKGGGGPADGGGQPPDNDGGSDGGGSAGQAPPPDDQTDPGDSGGCGDPVSCTIDDVVDGLGGGPGGPGSGGLGL